MSAGEAKVIMSSKRFLPLFICQFIGAFSDNIIRTAFATMVTYMALDLSPMTRSLIITLALGLFMLPFVIFSATGGILADKHNKAKLIRWIKFLALIITMIAMVGFYTNSYIILLFAIFLAGAESSFFGPVKYSILPDHLKRNELIIGNGLIEAGTFIAILLGIIIGGIIISESAGGVHSTSFLILSVAIIGFIAALQIPDTEAASEDINFNRNVVQETIDCVNNARKERDIFLAILGISWFWLIGGIFMSQMPTFTKETLNSDQSVLVMLLTVFSVGTGIGSLICNRILKGEIVVNYVPISILSMTFFVFMLWYTSTGFLDRDHLGGIHYFLSSLKGIAVCVEIFFISFFGGIYIVPLYAFLQVKAKRSHRSRIIAANNIFNALFIVIASVIAMGLLGIGVAVSNLILIIAIANLFTAMYICRILPDTIIKGLLQTLFKLIYRVEVEGMENFHKAGKRVLVIANHASFLDPPLLGAFLPASKLTFAIDTHISKSWYIRPFLSFLRAYPIDPTNAMATKTLIEKLREEVPVVIFPEGRITVTGSLMKIYEGPGLVADKADASLLPIRIDGVQYSPFSRLHGKIKLRLFPKIKITVLEPKKIEVPKEIVGRERRKIIGNQLYDIMSNMMFEGSENPHTLFESLIEAGQQFGSKDTIIEDVDKNELSYKRIIAGSFILGRKIAAKCEVSEKVGILLPNTSGTIVVFFATLAYGRTPAMLNFSTGIKNIISCCETAQIKTVYTSHRFIEKADFYDLIDELKNNQINVVYLEDVRKTVTIMDKLWGLVAATFPHKFYNRINKRKPKPNEPGVVLFTSGSEGTPKGVVLSHANIHANTKQLASRVDFNSSDKIFNAMPLFHSFGLTAGAFMPLLSGIRVFFYPSPLHYRIIPEMVYGSNATIFFGTDTFLSGYAKYAHPYDFFSIRYIFAGAEKLREDTRTLYMEKYGVRIFEGYGATEAAPVISVNTPMHCKGGTVGRIIPNMEHRLEKVKDINNGGRLLIKGPNIMLGYLKHDKPGVLQKPSHIIDGKEVKGWYDTGDIVNVDEDNYVTILGRAKRFAKIGGEMISLAAVEDTLQSLWHDFTHAVVNVPHPKKGEALMLFTDFPRATKEEILAYLKANGLVELLLPSKIVIMENLPLLGAGKVDYMKLKKLAEKEAGLKPSS